MSKNNLINLRDIDQDRANAIRSLGGKARQEQRKKETAFHNFLNDNFKLSNFFDNELETLLDNKPELNDYQKETIKSEFLKFLLERGYIRQAELTTEEIYYLSLYNEELDYNELKKYFRTRTPYKHKRGPKKRKNKPRTSSNG